MKKRIMNAIFENFNDFEIAKNVFETEEMKHSVREFSDRYIYTTAKLQDGQDEEYCKLAELLTMERENAFKIGFSAAVQLLMSGNIDAYDTVTERK